MPVRSYMQTCITPYRLLHDAMALIEQLCTNFDREVEEKAVVLINAAALHPSMSTYQLSMAHKALADCYFQHNFRGSALEHYQRGLSLNGSLAVKRRIQQLQTIPKEGLLSSASPDLIQDVFTFPEYAELVEENHCNTDALRVEIVKDYANSDKPKGLFDSEEECAAALEKVRQELKLKAEQENRTYDPANDFEVCGLLQSLSEADRSEFFRVREQSMRNRRDDETFSQRDLDILELQAMQRSAAFRGAG